MSKLDGLDEGGLATVGVAQHSHSGQVGLFPARPQLLSLVSHLTDPLPDLPLQPLQDEPLGVVVLLPQPGPAVLVAPLLLLLDHQPEREGGSQ